MDICPKRYNGFKSCAQKTQFHLTTVGPFLWQDNRWGIFEVSYLRRTHRKLSLTDEERKTDIPLTPFQFQKESVFVGSGSSS
jgi:hypothetical protein